MVDDEVGCEGVGEVVGVWELGTSDTVESRCAGLSRSIDTVSVQSLSLMV